MPTLPVAQSATIGVLPLRVVNARRAAVDPVDDGLHRVVLVRRAVGRAAVGVPGARVLGVHDREAARQPRRLERRRDLRRRVLGREVRLERPRRRRGADLEVDRPVAVRPEVRVVRARLEDHRDLQPARGLLRPRDVEVDAIQLPVVVGVIGRLDPALAADPVRGVGREHVLREPVDERRLRRPGYARAARHDRARARRRARPIPSSWLPPLEADCDRIQPRSAGRSPHADV